MFSRINKTAIEYLSWSLAIIGLIAGVIMRTVWLDTDTVRTAGLIVAITATVNQFIMGSRLKTERIKNGDNDNVKIDKKTTK